ncbi:MAG: hypothetical protein KAS73_11570 [Candidatus Sabulitectum sp.]|nr:hypothetical protein [Candidatus Sabulitectum sp.]
MRSGIAIGSLLFTSLVFLSTLSYSDSPPANTIPIISMKTGQGDTSWDITLDVICELLWNNFDGIWVEGWLSLYQGTPAELCDSTGAVMVLAPSELQRYNNCSQNRWARYSVASLQADNAFIHPDSFFTSIDSTNYATQIISSLNASCDDLADYESNYDCIWYYDIFNEGPAWQLNRMNDDSLVYDDYFPNMYTQDTLLNQIDSTGVFSWIKWKSDSMYTGDFPSVSVCFSSIHHIDTLEWGGCVPGVIGGTLNQQANSVRAYFNTKYLQYASAGPYDIYDNFPERIDMNAYPVRLAGYTWQTTPPDTITVLGRATDLWMLEHYEEILDSTFNAASSGPFPINYHAQGFGRTGGSAIWKINGDPPDTTICYSAYSYRIPSPAEFRMLCNIGLLRGAKGVFPYSIRSYTGWHEGKLVAHDTGLLDENLIPFDAPYKDWVYRERPTGDYYYAPPDSLPPWTAADGSQFDPLYSLPSRPILVPNDPKNHEYYLEWKFAAYARLWNSVRRTFGQIAQIAPELSGLWWWFGYEDEASIDFDGQSISLYFADPQIRVFTDSTETDCYLFYVNRFCRANSIPFEIVVSSDDFPGNPPFTEFALDHSRRFLIEGSFSRPSTYTFLDTLDAGEARLLQMIDPNSLPADVRITDPDVGVILPAKGDTLTDYRSVPGEQIDVLAMFYNMGTESKDSVRVVLYNETTQEVLDRSYVSFDGLSTASCWTTDRDGAILSWTPNSTYLGANVLSVSAETWHEEPDSTDNSATIVYIVDPRDYATEILDDPWDMTEATSSIPAWYTNDIDTLTGYWNSSAYTDSITGMFEGQLTDPSASNKLVLNTGSGVGDYIDADTYFNLALAGRSKATVDIELHWIDDDDNYQHTDIGEDFTAVARDIGPIDISALNQGWSGDIKKVWFEFAGGECCLKCAHWLG